MNKVGNTAAAEAYIKSAMTHVQAHYCHPSLGTKIAIQTLGKIKHYAGHNLESSGAHLREMWNTTLAELQGAHMMVYLAYDEKTSGSVGVASGPCICRDSYWDKYKACLVEWHWSYAEAGLVKENLMLSSDVFGYTQYGGP